RRWEIPAELTEAGAGAVVEQWLRLAPRPTAIYCFNNTLARFVLAELLRRGLVVPGDVSVMGGGGEEGAGLTCLQAAWHRLGRTAVQTLLRAPAGPGHYTPEHPLAPHTFQAGHTTATPWGSGEHRS